MPAVMLYITADSVITGGGAPLGQDGERDLERGAETEKEVGEVYRP